MHNNFTTKLLDLPDLVATELIQTEDLFIFIAESKLNHVKCPNCGKPAEKVHDRRTQYVQDIPIRDKKVMIKLTKKRYSCDHCNEQRAVPQSFTSVKPYARKTKRFDMHLLKQAVSRDYSRVALENELSYTSVENSINSILDNLIEAKVKDLSYVEAVSIDEFAIRKKHKYGVALTDPLNRDLINILPSRKKEDLIEYFNSNWTDKQRKQIKYFCMDMWSPYKAVAEEIFPNAQIVVDKFHLVSAVNKALDTLRKSEQSKQTKANRKKFFKSRLLLLKAAEELDDESHDKLIKIFELSPVLEKAWELKEEFRDLLQIDYVPESIQALDNWYESVSQAKLNIFYKVKKTIKRWEENLVNYFNTKITNGFAEGLNNKIKLIKRIGYGVPNLENLRRRVFLSLLSI